MRVAFLVGSLHIGGSELSAFRTARAIADKVSLTMYHLPADGPLVERYRAEGIRLVHAPIGGMLDPRLPLGILRLARALRTERIEVLHCHDYYANIVGALVAMLVPGLRLITSRRWRYEYHKPLHRRLDAWAARRADLVLANSDDLRRLLAEEVGVDRARIGLLPNFIADEAFEVARPNSTGDRAVVGSLGRISAVKNLRLALDAVVELVPRFPNLEWHVCGDGEQREEFLRWVAESGVSDHVVLRGPVKDGLTAARGFDILMLTSLSEGSPNAVLEAMAVGTPVVATAVGGVPEIVADGESGLLVPSEDRVALVAALTRLLMSPSLRRDLAMGGLEIAAKRKQSTVVKKLLSDYHGLISG